MKEKLSPMRRIKCVTIIKKKHIKLILMDQFNLILYALIQMDKVKIIKINDCKVIKYTFVCVS